MSQILCSKSGIIFQCEHMPIALSHREYHHPLFSVPKKRLLSLAGNWSTNKLTKPESYLLFLSLLDSTELLVWRSPAKFTSNTNAIVANNMESLLYIVGTIDIIKHPSFVLPKFAITPDTADLTNVYHWLQSWISNYKDWQDGYKFSVLSAAAERREAALERLIKSSHSVSISKSGDRLFKTVNSRLSTELSEWAEVAGQFPTWEMTHPITKEKVPRNEYWKQLIRACASMDSIWKYPESHIIELIDWCEDHILHHKGGSIHSHTLMSRLRGGLIKQKDFYDFGDIDISSAETRFTLLDSNDVDEFTVQAIGILNTAPKEEPQESQYKSKFLYLKARLSWDMARRKGAHK